MADTPMWEVAIPLIISIIIWIQGVPFIASAVGFIILCVIIFSIDSYTLEKKRKLKAQTYYEDNMPPIEQKLSMLDQEIKNAWQTDEAKRMDELIPDDYQSSYAVQYFLKVIENRRADSLKEAFNLFEEYKHQQKMEEFQQAQVSIAAQTLETQKETRDAARDTAHYSKKAWKSSRFGNALNVVNTVHHWKKK